YTCPMRKTARIASCVLLAALLAGASGQPDRRWSSFGGVRIFTAPVQDAVMGFSLPTQIMEVLARGGETVTKGQLLVRGEDSEDAALLDVQKIRIQEDLAIQAARKAEELAEVEYQRFLDAEQKGSATKQELDRARITLETRRIEVRSAELQFEQEKLQIDRFQARVFKYQLRAPFDGTIDQVVVDVGDSVSESDRVIRVVDTTRLRLDVPAPTDEVIRLDLEYGDPAWVLVDVAGDAVLLHGEIVEVSPIADYPSRSIRVRVEVDNEAGLKPGLTAYVRFTEPSDEWR
ncbi:MAG: efflux RND transporter periplasmic adaptor subunit, partial [Phycisphaerales bacterium]|nr:efflux RND transporter periplasmic adaptor subunit [Phycisphaerales bacterium]